MPYAVNNPGRMLCWSALMMVIFASTLRAQERAPVARPSWRLMLETGRAWGIGGGTPSGRGTTASVSGRRRLSRGSPVAFEFGLLFGNYDRPSAAREPVNPFGDAAQDTTRRLALVGTHATMSVDLLTSRRRTVFTEAGVYFGAVRERTRFDRTTTIDRDIGQRVGALGGVGVRLPNGFGAKARYLWVSVPSRPVNVAEVVLSATLF